MTKYLHKHNSSLSSLIREVVFGMEDGMVSTLGSITGIAIGSGDRFTVLLAGVVIIGVESISMGIGSYLSNKTSKEVESREIEDEKSLLKKDSEEEKVENLINIYISEGWPPSLASKMASHAVNDKRLLLKEHQTHELGIKDGKTENPVKNGLFMYMAYNLGGLIPLSTYFLLPISVAIYVSITLTLLCLFVLGVGTTIFTKSAWFRSGLRMFVLGGVALLAGVVIGEAASKLGFLLPDM